MTIKPVTSLADLEFKAKTDKHYEQLTILGCRSITFGSSRIKTYRNALKKLTQISVDSKGFNDIHCCDFVITYVNSNCSKIQPIVEPTPVSQLIKRKQAQKIVDNLNSIVPSKKRIRRIARRVV